ncbi:MAG TPA: SURF1 family protein, partial [Xanthobacteraceae bacterium]|nr:SURF1 family protein [Xanthobacteraceae bacterium]
MPGMRRRSSERRSWLGLLVPALIAFAILIGLGVWQIERKAWKEGLIAALTERLAAPPQALPAAADWPKLDRADDEYRRVSFTAQFDNAKAALVFASASGFRPDVSDAGPGYWVFTPARLADGSTVMVNRGFVPDARKDPQTRLAGEVSSPVALVGVMRWPDSRHWFTPSDDAAHNLWFTRDPSAIALAKGAGSVAPFYVEQETPVPPGGLPQPGKLVVSLPDNHLQYALTWFGLAAVLMAVFISWAVSSSRSGGRE